MSAPPAHLDRLMERAAVVEGDRRRRDRAGGDRDDLVAGERLLVGRAFRRDLLRGGRRGLVERREQQRAAALRPAAAAVAPGEAAAHLALEDRAQVLLHVAPPAVEEEVDV